MNTPSTDRRIGIVVPTLGTRSKFLHESLLSIRQAGPAFVAVVVPDEVDLSGPIGEGLIDLRISDPKRGLSVAIDLGLRSLPENIEYMNWLGDDDVLTEQSLVISARALDEARNLSFVYGSCDYIDHEGRLLWHNRSGPWASWLLRFGPDLIPQPGALIRRSAYNRIGGLSPQYGWAFDLDLFLRLQSVGPSRYLPDTLSMFRWHEGSLSVGARPGSSNEARDIRKNNLPHWARPVRYLWEGPFRLAGNLMVRRLSSKSAKLTTSV